MQWMGLPRHHGLQRGSARIEREDKPVIPEYMRAKNSKRIVVQTSFQLLGHIARQMRFDDFSHTLRHSIHGKVLPDAVKLIYSCPSTAFASQMSAMYPLIVRSDENQPERAVFRTAIRPQEARSR